MSFLAEFLLPAGDPFLGGAADGIGDGQHRPASRAAAPRPSALGSGGVASDTLSRNGLTR